MSDLRADMASMRRVIEMAGLAFPRGVLGPEAMDLAAAIGLGAPDPALVDALIRRVASAQWLALQAPMNASLARVPVPDNVSDARALEQAIGFAEDADPENPLALALAERAGLDLAAMRARALDRLEALAVVQADGTNRPEALVALASTAGRLVSDLLDLDPDDFAHEIADYADVETTAEVAAPELARATGDIEIRTWAREALASLDVPAPPRALAAVRAIADGDVPVDAADDVVWTSTIIVLAEEAIELAAVEMDPPEGAAADS